MLPSLIYFALCLLAGYAIIRLGQLLDRMEADEFFRLQAALEFDQEKAPPSRAGFLSDLVAAILLSALFIACLWLAFAL
jgi:hypothetical protein